jgi:opacity protein-like surface antigen
MKRVIVVPALLAALAAPAAAQQARTGWWGEGSFGYGYLRVGTADDEVRRTEGASTVLRVGRKIGARTSVGLEGTWFVRDRDSALTQVFGLHAIAMFDPWRSLPLHLHLGVGFADGKVQVSVPVTQVFKARGTGVGLSFGAGYDIRVGRHLAITPSVGTHIAALGDFTFSPTAIADDVIGTAYHVGIGITWR